MGIPNSFIITFIDFLSKPTKKNENCMHPTSGQDRPEDWPEEELK